MMKRILKMDARLLLKLMTLVLIFSLWLVSLSGAAWLANQPSDLAVIGAVLMILVTSFICVKGAIVCLKH